VLHIIRKNLNLYLDGERIYHGEGRGESGVCLHIPIKNYVAGTAPGEDHALMLSVANTLIEYLLYKRERKGPEAWDYDAEKANEIYAVCGDNISSSGIIIFDRNYAGGAKLQVFLDKTFGSNEVSVLWKNQLVGDEFLLDDFRHYMRHALTNGEFSGAE
jgi:hypothetical protein